jgi:hypothetical protein
MLTDFTYKCSPLRFEAIGPDTEEAMINDMRTSFDAKMALAPKFLLNLERRQDFVRPSIQTPKIKRAAFALPSQRMKASKRSPTAPPQS